MSCTRSAAAHANAASGQRVAKAELAQGPQTIGQSITASRQCDRLTRWGVKVGIPAFDGFVQLAELRAQAVTNIVALSALPANVADIHALGNLLAL